MKAQDDCQLAADGSRTDVDAQGGSLHSSRPAEPACPWRKRGWFLGLVLAAATLLAYQPAWNGQPVYDDDDHLTPPELQSLTGLARIWTELGVVSQYYPVAHSAFWLQQKLWAYWMPGYHLVNILLHVFCALLLVRVLKRLEIPGAWLAAAIFALHPVLVESVAWISEMKNTLSGVFYLGAALAYLEFDGARQRRYAAEIRNPNPRNPNEVRNPKPESDTTPPKDAAINLTNPGHSNLKSRPSFESRISSFGFPYLIAFLLFAAGLLSKSVIASLPAALLVVFWWKRGRLSWKPDVLPLIPFFVAALAMGIFTAWIEKKFIGAEGEDFHLSQIERCLIAGRAVWFYLGKLFWPVNLTFIYPRWQVSAAVWWQYLFPAAALLLLAVLWTLRRRWRGPLAALLFFGGTLFPALGFINVYPFRYSFVADHYLYLAALGPMVLAAALVKLETRNPKSEDRMACRARFEFRVSNFFRISSFGFRISILIILGVLSWRQCRMYRDVETLWRTTIARNPSCFAAYSNLGNDLLNRGQVDEAIRMCERALELQPAFAEPHNNLANALLKKGRVDEALEHYRKALHIRPDLAAVHVNVGYILLQRGRLDEAMARFRKAVELRPDFTKAHIDLGNALLQKGRVDEAIVHLRKALELRPGDPEAHSNLGNALLQKGQADAAIVHFRKALEVRPDDASSCNDLGNALMQQGRRDEAIDQYRRALAILPDFDLAHYNLGQALLQKGETDRAISHFKRAVEVQPDLVAARYQLGNTLLEHGRVDEAIVHYRKAIETQPDFMEARLNLASALLRKGQAQDVAAQCRAALKIQPDNPEVLSNLAWLLSTWPEASLRNGTEAIELARKATRLTGGRDPLTLRALAAACAEAGQFADATATAQQALKLATSQNDTGLAEALQSELKLYEAGAPVRDPAR